MEGFTFGKAHACFMGEKTVEKLQKRCGERWLLTAVIVCLSL